MEPLLRAINLSQSVGRLSRLQDLSFQGQPGEVVGLRAGGVEIVAGPEVRSHVALGEVAGTRFHAGDAGLATAIILRR